MVVIYTHNQPYSWWSCVHQLGERTIGHQLVGLGMNKSLQWSPVKLLFEFNDKTWLYTVLRQLEAQVLWFRTSYFLMNISRYCNVDQFWSVPKITNKVMCTATGDRIALSFTSAFWTRLAVTIFLRGTSGNLFQGPKDMISFEESHK